MVSEGAVLATISPRRVLARRQMHFVHDVPAFRVYITGEVNHPAEIPPRPDPRVARLLGNRVALDGGI